jgi:rare lipoprotein A
MLNIKVLNLLRYLVFGFLFSLIVGCATSSYNGHHNYHHTPYVKFSQTGYASFYGHHDGFNGEEMANGDKFNANNKHMAAHPYLPLGTKLKVTNLKTHKVLYVEVTDRMGHVRHIIIDLSYGAAKYFKMQKSGLAHVHIKTVTEKEYKDNI